MKKIGKDFNGFGPAWELEVLVLILAVLSAVLPFVWENEETRQAQEMSIMQQAVADQYEGVSWVDVKRVAWAAAAVGLFSIHLWLNGSADENVSTPINGILMPVAFGAMLYHHLIMVSDGNQVHPAAYFLVLVLSTFLLARLCVLRNLRKFDKSSWDITANTVFDATWFSLILHGLPLFYPPRKYSAGSAGILIGGCFFIVLLPFDEIEAVRLVGEANTTDNGVYYATSTNSLIRVELSNHIEPVYISPSNRNGFFLYVRLSIGQA